MSDSVASLRRKIGGAGDLQSVVRTMKAVAASSIGQYEKAVEALADYYQTVELGLSVCLRKIGAQSLIADGKQSSQPAATGAVVFGSDQGLVGQFNDVVADYAVDALNAAAGDVQVWAVGSHVQGRLSDAQMPIVGTFQVPTSVDGITLLVGKILVECESRQSRGEITDLYLFYNRPTTGAGYKPVSQRLLPLDETWRRKLVEIPWPTKVLPEVVGDSTATLGAFISGYLFVSLFRACAESLASENASRLAAMQHADKNIDDLLEQLNGKYHRLRQSRIDEELFDVIASFESLSKGKGGQNSA